MDDLKNLINKIKGLNNKGTTKIDSPVPAGDTMTKGLEWYYKMNAQKEKQAAQRAPVQQQTRQVKYPNWLANAPSPEQRRKIEEVRNNPILKGLSGVKAKMGADTLPSLDMQNGLPAGLTMQADQRRKTLPNQNADQGIQMNLPQNNEPKLERTYLQAAPEVTPEEEQILQGSTQVAPQVDQFLTNTALPITRKYGIPDAVVAGQFAREGRFNGIGAQLNNFFNIGFTDTKAEQQDYGSVPRYPTPAAGVEAYAKFITGQAPTEVYANGWDGAPSGKIGQKQLQEIHQLYSNDPIGYLKAIGPMYSSQGHQYAPNVMNTPEFRRFYNY